MFMFYFRDYVSFSQRHSPSNKGPTIQEQHGAGSVVVSIVRQQIQSEVVSIHNSFVYVVLQKALPRSVKLGRTTFILLQMQELMVA